MGASDGNRVRHRMLADLGDDRLNMPKAQSGGLVKPFTFHGQRNAIVPALEQPNSDVAFKIADKPADRGLGHAQIRPGPGETPQPRCAVKYRQGI